MRKKSKLSKQSASQARANSMLAEMFFLKDLRDRLSYELETIESRIRNLESGIASETDK